MRKNINISLLAIISLTLLASTQTGKFVINPTERCNITSAGKTVHGIPNYFVNDDKQTQFSRINARDHIYFIPSEEKIKFSNDKTTTIIEMKNGAIKESGGDFFIDGEKVGSVKNGDVIILYSDGKVHVYNEARVSIK